MTTQELISTYQLNFFNAIEEIGNTPKVIDKRLTTFNELLTGYLYEWERSEIIDSDLLPDLQLLLNDEVEKFDDSSTFAMIIANNAETRIYANNSAVPDVVIPTQDFHDMIILWRDFLNESPLSGTLVDGTTGIIV